MFNLDQHFVFFFIRLQALVALAVTFSIVVLLVPIDYFY